LDNEGNPVVQVAGDQTFDSAEFVATVSPLTFGLADGTSFTADSNSMDVLLLPSSGETLTVDVDQTTIDVSGTVQTITPEPSGRDLLLLVLAGLAWGLHRRRALHARTRVRI
jgi:hypothetical protein